MPDDPLILALDVPTSGEALELVAKLGSRATFYKVGMELYAGAGMGIVQELLARGKNVFLDLKLHDIGETVRRAVGKIAESGVMFLTVHGTPQVMRAAVEGRADSAMKLLGVTVLTSLDDDDLHEDGYSLSVKDLVGLRVKQALKLGMDGVVASAEETAGIRDRAGSRLLIVTPGVRSAGSARGDQKRVASPLEALENGCDYLVIGRQVTRAADPASALAALREEIAGAARSADAAR